MFFRSALLVAGAGLAVAQSISSNCTSALLAIATSSETSCLDLTLLAPLVTSNSSTTSVIPTLNSWLTGLCGQGACTNATLQTVVTNITAGCSSEIASLDLPTSNISSLVTAVEVAYPIVRDVACLKDTSANSLCATELLTDIQDETGTIISLQNAIGVIAQSDGLGISIPQNVTCSNCSKAAYNIVAENFPNFAASENSSLESECGASFTNGQTPSNIQETASNSTSTSSTSGAVSLSLNSQAAVGVTLLATIASAFVVFT